MQFRLIQFLLLIIVPFTVVILSNRGINDPSINIADSKTFEVNFYCDTDEGGSSTVYGERLGTDQYIMTYSLGNEGYDYPYAILMITRRDSYFFDFSKYDIINIKLKSSNSRSLDLTVFVYLENFTKVNENSTYLPLVMSIETDKMSKEYNLNIADFTVPRWWYLENNIIYPDSINYSLNSIAYLTLGSSDDKQTGIEDEVVLERISILKNKKRIYINTVNYILGYYILLFTIYLIFNNKLKSRKIITYRPLEISENPKSKNIIEEYIGLNYSNSQLDLTKIATDLDLSIKYISNYINKKFKLSFPIYLNYIRINEAKTLLLTTDNKIIDIVINVGFNSASHFNRVFKNLEHCTPSEYRKEKKYY